MDNFGEILVLLGINTFSRRKKLPITVGTGLYINTQQQVVYISVCENAPSAAAASQVV